MSSQRRISVSLYFNIWEMLNYLLSMLRIWWDDQSLDIERGATNLAFHTSLLTIMLKSLLKQFKDKFDLVFSFDIIKDSIFVISTLFCFDSMSSFSMLLLCLEFSKFSNQAII